MNERDRLVIDTNIVIYCANGNRLAYDALKGFDVVISKITRMELLSYSKLDDLPEQQRAIGHLLSFFQLSDIDDAVEDVAIFLRKRYKLSLPDAIVAGTAYVHDIPLLTADKKLAKIEEIAVLEFLTT